ncbi:group III truncated hemoglobin [Ohtaekwangia kribbensis]|jgi:hemoglobin|uniref:Group III truncated hemoglobin n=1 Tax=Ohtaekwangia kribbensis TaxID=688913 RepID=A0ABW3K977_9BACT
MTELPDIIDRSDVIKFVDRFYDKVKEDALLGPQFAHVNWSSHLPVMYNFWSSMLFGEQSYQGNPLQRHMALPIGVGHFNRWLQLFQETIDENFFGFNAEELKMRAQAIARVFQIKMGLTNRDM